MQNQRLVLQHPIDRLELYELHPDTWDSADPPPLYLIDDLAVVPMAPYMGPLRLVEVERRDHVECLEDGRFNYYFKLTGKVNGLWLALFEHHRGGLDVAFHGDMLILRCDQKDLEKNYEEICDSAIYLTTNDYRRERAKLVWLVFEKMQERERREHTKAEIEAELESYRRQRHERSLVALRNGWPVPFVVRNFNGHYREILENKFVWWFKVLNDATARYYRAKFEEDLLVD